MSVTLDNVKSLLGSEELRAVEEAVASQLGLRLLPAEFATPYQRELNWADISYDEALQTLRDDRERLIRFWLAIQASSADDDIDGEFAPGEELDEDEKSELIKVLGLAQGTGLSQLCFWVLARRGDRATLLSFLRWRRIPGANQFARELLQFANE